MNRKDEHVSLAKAFHKPRLNDFDAVQIIHQSFPRSIAHKSLWKRNSLAALSLPLFINAMTGGSEKSKKSTKTWLKLRKLVT